MTTGIAATASSILPVVVVGTDAAHEPASGAADAGSGDSGRAVVTGTADTPDGSRRTEPVAAEMAGGVRGGSRTGGF